MKDNRNSPFIHDLSRSLVVTGSSIPQATSYTRFNHFQYSDTEVGTYIPDFGDPTASYVVVEGDRGGSTGNHSPTTGSLAQLDIYGEKVYTDKLVRPGLSTRAVMSQRGLSLPLSPGAAEPLFIAKDAASIYSTAAYAELSMMVKLKLTSTANDNHSVVTIASAGDPTTDAFSINVTGNEISSLSTGDTDSPPSSSVVDISSRDFVTVFATFYNTADGNSVLSRFGVYDVGTGEEVSFEDQGNDSGAAVDLIRPFIYVGYGRGQGATNNEFDAADFASINVAEIAFFDSDLTQEQMQTIARSHLSENQYKSGFNNRAPKRTQQLLDAKSVYPASANPLSPGTSTLPFDDQKTKFFGTGSWANSSDKIDIMYPEMLPAHMFSGSAEGRGAEGDVRSFYRDQHHTEYDKRLVAPGAMRQGLSHKETELFNIGTRNSPVVIGEDSDILGGAIQPFDDSHPLADKNEQPAVDEDVIPGLSQRLGDHVAIIIDLDPVDDTTVGVERTGGSKSWLGDTTGRVTSMAYFNFSTKKWETAGKNNDFIIPGAIDVGTGSSLDTELIGPKLRSIYETGFKELFNSSSVGFAGTSGFTIFENKGEAAFSSLERRAVPVTTYGFPIHQKYEAKDDQLIDMSQYIDAPFVLERISLEAGIAVEESGPHSLGYRIHQDTEVPVSPNSRNDQNVKSTRPALRFYTDRDGNVPEDGGFSDFQRMYFNYLKYQRVNLKRGSFINGSWCVDINDFTVSSQVDIDPDLWVSYYSHGDVASLSSGVTNPHDVEGSLPSALASILIGAGNKNRIDLNLVRLEQTDLRFNPGFSFLEGEDTIWDESYFKLEGGAPYPANVMLPVVDGPRTGTGRSVVAAGYNDGIYKIQGRTYPHPNTGPGVGAADHFIECTPSYIPVLAAGVNGVVTGSTNLGETHGQIHWRPIATVEKRKYAPNDSTVNASNEPLGYTNTGGVPFWRADTFFLMRQAKASTSRVVRHTFTLKGGSSKVFFPIAPYATCDQPQKAYSFHIQMPGGGTAGKSEYSGPAVLDVISPGLAMNLMHGMRAPSDSFSLGEIDTSVSGVRRIQRTGVDVNLFNSGWESSSETVRELISFGQITHYGYAAAQDGYVDKIMDDIAVGDAPSNSGSIESGFENSIRNVDQALFGQAAKISRKANANTCVIPSNIDKFPLNIYSENVSAFSDAPDTYQGQWAFQVGELPPGFHAAAAGSLGVVDPTHDQSPFLLGHTFVDRSSKRDSIIKGDGTNSFIAQPRYTAFFSAVGNAWNTSNVKYAHSLDTWQPIPFASFYGDSSYTGNLATHSASVSWPSADDTNWTHGSSADHIFDTMSGPNAAIHGNLASPEELIVGGTGFSIISTPAWPVSQGQGTADYSWYDGSVYTYPSMIGHLDAPYITDANGNKYVKYNEISLFGGFNSRPMGSSFDRSEATTNVEESPLANLPSKTWLEAGLSKETNILIGEGHTHQGTNIDFDDNWAGFTLMTASTVQRPFEAPGRESASLPLQGNVYKRQWLNFDKNVSLEFKVKSVTPSTTHDPGYWVVTAPDVWGPRIAPENEGGRCRIYTPEYVDIGTGGPSHAGPGSKIAIFADHGKRFHRRYTATVTDGFRPGPLADGFNSSRVFFRRAVAANAINTKITSFPIRNISAEWSTNIAFFTSAGYFGGFVGSADASFANALSSQKSDQNTESDLFGTTYSSYVDSSVLTGSVSDTPDVEGLYILQPTDKLILGLQPALPGWNEGSGLPNNRWANKWGVWDDKESYARNYARAFDVDNEGNIIENSRMNLEDPYEPCHGLTMLSGKSRLVLYGTFLRDNKHYSPSSKQKLTSPAVHEALHYDNPVLDQFLTENAYEYAGSNLEQHVAGEMLEGNRGVVGKLSDGSLVFSGSFQRFARSAETSQVFYDTLTQDPFDIATALNGLSNKANVNSSDYAVINLHHLTQGYVTSSNSVVGEPLQVFGPATYAHASGWQDSFPFEEKFSSVRRSTSNSLRFGSQTTAVYRLPHPKMVWDRAGSSPADFEISATGQADILATFAGISNPNVLDDGSIGALTTHAFYAPGLSVAQIGNMAVSRVSPIAGQGTGYTPELSATDRRAQRLFFATMLGYGRQNRKQLDVVQLRHIQQRNSSPYSYSQLRGSAYYGHPAGFKYGYMNCDYLSPSAVHRADRYGQFRDMLEQRLYGKVYSFGDEFNKRGESEAAVTCIFVDADGAPIDDATKTQCLNLSTSAASTKPFIEGEVLREIIINSESVTIE